MAQADCVVLMLADAAAIRAVLLAQASLAVFRGKTVIQIGNHRSG
jgi:3-hydroxyisobutyrate dehydrogenase-like beta-hydroxyacid dehydrogenase